MDNVNLCPKSESREICMDMSALGDCGVGSKAFFSPWQETGRKAIITQISKPLTGIHRNNPILGAVTLAKRD